MAYDSLDDRDHAEQCLKQALAVTRRMGDHRAEADILVDLGLSYRSSGQPARALGAFQEALAIDHGMGDRAGEANALANLGLAYGELGDYVRASDCFEKALLINRAIGDRESARRTRPRCSGRTLYLLRRRQRGVTQQALHEHRRCTRPEGLYCHCAPA